VGPLVSGPDRPADDRSAAPFEVPAAPAPRFGFGRVEPGPAWPGDLPELRRLVAFPLPAELIEAGPSDAVLCLCDAAGDRTVLCARSDGGAACALRGILR